MFFSLDPNVFRNPKSCSLSNGTTIYSNHSIAQDCSCVAPFDANPDFAGPGIIASFCFLAWFTILIAAIPAFYTIRRSWRRAQSPHRFWTFLTDILQLRVTEAKSPEARPLAPQPERSSNLSSTSVSSDGGDVEKTNPTSPCIESESYEDAEPRPVLLAKALLVSLTDVQAVIGLAYIIAGLASVRHISYYHEQFVTNLWWLTLNSLWVSRIDYNENTPNMAGWRCQARRLTILASVGLSAVFQGIVAVREKNHWEATQPGRCYVGAGLGSNFGDNVFWLIGTALYAFVLVLGSWSWTRRVFDEQVLERVDPSLATMWGWAHGSFEELQRSRCNTCSPVRQIFLLAKTTCFSLAFLTWWCTIQFLAIWSSGVGSCVVEMLVYTGFAVESTVWVIYLKIQNRVLVQGGENKWTFGQMLPLTLLVLVLFYTLDAANDIPTRTRKQTVTEDP